MSVSAAGLLTPGFPHAPGGEPMFPRSEALGLSGSRGVPRANNAAEVEAAEAHPQTAGPAGDSTTAGSGDRFIQVEEYIPGREFAVEGARGRLRVWRCLRSPIRWKGRSLKRRSM